MPYLIAISATLALMLAFLALTYAEAARGFRVLPGLRKRLDRRVGQAAFIVEHVDLGAFTRDAVRASAERIAHDIAHATLVAVRFVERVLTRFVRSRRDWREGRAADGARPRRSLREAVRHVRITIRLRRMSIQEKDAE